MRKLIFALLATTIILTGCSSQKAPYQDIIEKYIHGYEYAYIPAEHQEIAGAMMANALRELESDDLDTEDILYKWTYTDPDDNFLGLGGITLSVISGDVEKNYSLLFN